MISKGPRSNGSAAWCACEIARLWFGSKSRLIHERAFRGRMTIALEFRSSRVGFETFYVSDPTVQDPSLP
jgi:hypothetical protein